MQEPFHPIADEYPMMSTDEFDRLTVALKERGYWPELGKIVTLDGTILDGRNRWKACRAAGINPLDYQIEYSGSTDEETLRKFVESANDHRRHESPEARQARRQSRIERVIQRRKEGESLRMIAEKEGVSEAQVRADLQKSTAHGCAVEPESGMVMGKDGKERPARRPANSTAHSCAVEPASGKPVVSVPEPQRPEPDHTQRHPDDEVQRHPDDDPPKQQPQPAKKISTENPVDGLGNPIPEKLRDVFLDAWLADTVGAIKQWHEGLSVKPILTGVRARYKHYPWLRLQDFIEQVEGLDAAFELALETARQAVPFAVCDRCGGDGCDLCLHSGYVTQWKWEELQGS